MEVSIPAYRLFEFQRGAYVYGWRRGDVWLYVGQTQNVLNRLGNHNIVDTVEAVLPTDTFYLRKCSSLSEALEHEQYLIRTHKPTYNIAGLTPFDQREKFRGRRFRD